MGTVTQTARGREPVTYEPLLTPGEVATMFRVHPKQVTRWARTGKLRAIRTIGGHRRFFAAEAEALMEESRQERTS